MKWIGLLSLCATLALSLQHQFHQYMTEDERANFLGAASIHETPDYDLTTPFESDRHGAPHTRRRRETPDSIYFKLSAFGEEYHLEVKHNTDLLAPGFFVQIAGQTGQSKMDFDSVEPCHYTGELKSHSPSHVAVSDCDEYGLTGLIATNSTQLLLQPLPEHLIKSIANEAGHTHLVYKRASNMTNSTQPIKLERRSNCSVEGSIPPSYYPTLQLYRNRKRLREKLDENRTRYVVEGFVVTDTGLYQKHGSNPAQLTRYVVTLMNIASSMYNQFLLGINVRLVLTRIYMFTNTKTEEEQGLYITHDSRRNLDSFSAWQSNPSRYVADDNDPLHYDHAFLFISKGMCFDSNEDCWELGRAWIGSVCSRGGSYAASVNADKGLQLGYVFAHELGHNLGMYHDGKDGQCSSNDGYVMAPSTSNAKKIFLWSDCSKAYLLDSLRKGSLNCLKDCTGNIQPEFGQTPSYVLPGKIYDKDTQCQLGFLGSSGFCPGTENEMCEYLWCTSPDTPGGCVGAYVAAADGTSCGSDKKICYRRECVKEDSIVPPILPPRTICSEETCDKDPNFPPIDGNWSSWKQLTACSRSCGGGFSQQQRECNNPSPHNCGENCKGESTRKVLCNTKSCQDDTDYRAAQCSDENSEAGVTDLRPAYLFGESQLCDLHCYSPNNEIQHHGGKVVDGTKCDQYNNNRCYNGECESVGCNNKLGSNIQPDYCGTCGGNNDTCRVVKKKYTQQQQTSGYYSVDIIPAGAKRIRVEEIQPSTAIVLAASVNNQRFLGVSSNTYELIDIAGTTFEYHRPSDGPEILVAPGPTTEDIQLEALIYARRGTHLGLQYMYTVPKFIWKPKKFGKCTATCGGGVQTRTLVCRDAATSVKASASDCTNIAKPPTSQSCNTMPCFTTAPPTVAQSFFWKPKQFGKCSATCGGGVQTRRLVCRDAVTSMKTSASDCANIPKPPISQRCNTMPCFTTAPPTVAQSFFWKPKQFGKCSVTCGGGVQTRRLVCRDVVTSLKTGASDCANVAKPPTTQSCNTQACNNN